MDYDSIARNVARIREELLHIGEKNRHYFLKKHHREYEALQHQGRHERILQLKSELEGMLRTKVPPGSRHSPTGKANKKRI